MKVHANRIGLRFDNQQRPPISSSPKKTCQTALPRRVWPATLRERVSWPNLSLQLFGHVFVIARDTLEKLAGACVHPFVSNSPQFVRLVAILFRSFQSRLRVGQRSMKMHNASSRKAAPDDKQSSVQSRAALIKYPKQSHLGAFCAAKPVGIGGLLLSKMTEQSVARITRPPYGPAHA